MTSEFPSPSVALPLCKAASKLVYEWTPTGSYHICRPRVEGTDRDYALRVHNLTSFGTTLEEHGWDVSWDDPEYRIDHLNEHEFITARKGINNLIVFENEEAFWAFSAATEVACSLNLLRKEERILLFRAVCGNRGQRR